MLRALIGKQLREAGTIYFQDRKTGALLKGGKLIRHILLFAALYGMLWVSFFGMALGSASMLVDSGFMAGDTGTWLYYAMMGMLAMMLGTFAGVFTTYASVYKAKDNELLLSLPIPPKMILFSRLVSVFTMSLFYTGLVWIPTVLACWIMKLPTVTGILFPLLLFPLLSLVVMVLSSLLGWFVAKISAKLKNRNISIVLLSLAGIGLYLFLVNKLDSGLTYIVEHAADTMAILQSYVYPLVLFGKAACGYPVEMAGFTCLALLLAAGDFLLLSRGFDQLMSTHEITVKKEVKASDYQASSLSKGLLKRELQHFLSSPTYMLNCGLGIVMMPVAAVMLVLKADSVLPVLEIIGFGKETMVILASAGMCLISGMDIITAPSISLEGNSFWILRSLPVSTKQILDAKRNLHVLLNLVPCLGCMLVLGILFGAGAAGTIAMLVLGFFFNLVTADLGLVVNLHNVNLTWTTEAEPIKRSLSTVLAMFGSMLLGVVIQVGYLAGGKVLGTTVYLYLAAAVMVVLYVLLDRYLATRGCKLFESV